MTYLRFGIRDLLWAMVVVSSVLLAWRFHLLHEESAARAAQLEQDNSLLSSLLKSLMNRNLQVERSHFVLEEFSEMPLAPPASERKQTPEEKLLQEFLEGDTGHLLFP
jgi:hypothetical protein